jgi:sigma-B regulation protein RsbU (phosphoserine phosphatase)
LVLEVLESQANLTSLLAAHRSHLASLDQAWLAQGAASYGVWDIEGAAVANWPEAASPPGPGLSAPLRVGGTVLGELRLSGLSGAPHALRLAAEANLLGQLASLEETLENITNELIDKQDQLIALYDLNRAMRRQVTVDETLQSLAEGAAHMVGAETAIALLNSSDFSRHEALAHYPARPPVRSGPLIVHQLLEAGKAIILSQVNSPIELPAAIQNLLFVPILVRDAKLAGLALFNKTGGFTSPDLKLIKAIAQQGGAQLENVLLYQETLAQTKVKTELELAARLQLRLLPHANPMQSGLDVFGHTKPALQVGGDFFDYIEQHNRAFMFTVGDITGKGLPAAMLMTMVRTVLHNAAKFIPNPSPEIVLNRVNEDLYDDFTELGMFSTVFMGQYLQAEQTMCYANAGHSPVVYCPAHGPAELLEPDGPPVGVLPINLSENKKIIFGPGDLLVVMSDGFSEASNAEGELFGYDRLLQLIGELAGKSAAEIGHSLFEEIKQFGAGQPQDDDQTLVVIKGVEV